MPTPETAHRLLITSLLGLALLALGGCDQLGIETPAQTNARQDAEGRAVGGACRHSGRALEDCYALNKRASKASVYAGWRDMDAYMRENKIEIVPSSQGEIEKKPAEGESAKAESTAPEKAKGGDKATGEEKAPRKKT